MSAIRYFRVPISVGDWQHTLYLYETESGLFDLQYHWMYTSCMHGNLQDTLIEFHQEFTRHHELNENSKELHIGDATPVDWSEVQAARPSNQPSPYFRLP